MQQRQQIHVLLALWLLAACGAAPAVTPVVPAAPPAAPTIAPLLRDATAAPTGVPTTVTITVDTTADQRPISPLIYGLSGGSPEIIAGIRPPFKSWGGNPSTRYNWRLGNAWNTASDWYYHNTNYDNPPGSVSDRYIAEAHSRNAEVRLALPTLGWVAKDTDPTSCSFPNPDGTCGDAGKADCTKPGPRADPTRTSVTSDVTDIVAWVQDMQSKDLLPRYLAMDNEPELWGVTHYDVHPECTTYAEIRDTYLRYASAIRAVAPEAQLLGPGTCCWYFYWNSAAGDVDKLRNGNQDFIPWFLSEVRAHDQKNNTRTLDVLDIHYYPDGLYNDDVSPERAAHRLRAPRSLWDPSYKDESWINEPVQLIPRMRALIDTYYPGLKFSISEWNFGADKTHNGALAIADVLGIFGRHGVDMAAYWRNPDLNTPGYFAFRMYTNYDGQGARFADTAVSAVSSAPTDVTSYAATDANGRTTLMLINKTGAATSVALDLRGVAGQRGTLFSYGPAAADQIVSTPQSGIPATLNLPADTITLLVIQ